MAASDLCSRLSHVASTLRTIEAEVASSHSAAATTTPPPVRADTIKRLSALLRTVREGQNHLPALALSCKKYVDSLDETQSRIWRLHAAARKSSKKGATSSSAAKKTGGKKLNRLTLSLIHI